MRFIDSSGKLISASKNVDKFKTSKGYVEGFKSRYNLAFKKLHGEGAAVNTDVVDDWFAKIPHLIAEYGCGCHSFAKN